MKFVIEEHVLEYRLKVALSDWRFKAKLTGNKTKTLLEEEKGVREIWRARHFYLESVLESS